MNINDFMNVSVQKSKNQREISFVLEMPSYLFGTKWRFYSVPLKIFDQNFAALQGKFIVLVGLVLSVLFQ